MTKCRTLAAQDLLEKLKHPCHEHAFGAAAHQRLTERARKEESVAFSNL